MTKIAAGQKFATVASTVDTTERKSTTQNAKTETYTIEDVKETVLGTPDDILYTEVSFSSAQIATMGTPLSILAAPAAGKYYEIQSLILEYNHNTTAFTTTSPVLYLDGAMFGNISSALITTAGNQVAKVTMSTTDTFVDVSTYVLLPLSSVGVGLTIATWNSDNPAGGGDGTLLVKVRYVVRTFGSEL